MADVNLQLVRECFELNVFRVLTNWQQDSRFQFAESTGQLFVENTALPVPRELPFVLRAEDIPAIDRAVIEVRAWHGDRFYPSVIEANPVLSQFVAPESLALARELFKGLPFVTVLVVSELPLSMDLRDRSAELLRRSGIGHVLEFPVLLQDLLNKVESQGMYVGSQTLQTLRLLKRYKFIRHQQMDLPFKPEAHVPPMPPPVHVVEAPANTLDEDNG
ncbi:MAG: hypothetical protein AMXMBFR84_40560 [Candidatus Hydrogenedentota bacterium]